MLTVGTIKKKDMVITITSTHALPEGLLDKVKHLIEEEDKTDYVTFEEFEEDYKASLKKEDTIGYKIKMIRLSKGIKQIEVAKAIGMKQPQLSDIEKGTHLPSMKTLKKIASILEADIEELI